MVRRSIVVCLAVLSVAALAWCDRKADLDNNGGDQTPAVQTRTVAPGSEAVRAASPARTAGLWSSNGAAWDWLDDFDGPNAVLAVGATNAALPGPGADAVFGTGQVEIIDHVARLKGSGPGPCPCALSPTGPGAELPAHTPGKAIVAYLAVPDAAAANRDMQHVIGNGKETAERRLRAVLTKDNTLFSHPSVLPPKEKTPAGTIQSGPDGHLYWHNGADWKRLDK